MELEELQAVWSEMSDQLEQQKKLTNEIIIKMTQQDYRNKLNKIVLPETLGAVVSFVAAALILFNFNTLDTWPLRVCGIITLAIILILPIFSIRYLKKMQSLDIANNNYKQTVADFAKNKKQYEKLLKLSVYLGFGLMIIIMPVTSKLFNGEDMFRETMSWFWVWFLPLGMLFYYFFTRRVIRCYNNNIRQAETILEELEQGE